MLTFNFRYFIFAVLLFVTEVYIAVYVHDDFVRPHVGDFLVVILIYCLMKAFLNVSVWRMAMAVLLFSYTVEILQYFQVVNLLGLGHSQFARIIIGTSFSWIDMLAYTLGIGCVLMVEWIAAKRR